MASPLTPGYATRQIAQAMRFDSNLRFGLDADMFLCTIEDGIVKHKQLARELGRLGWFKVSDKGKHEKWSNGVVTQPVPRHKEINEQTARAILRFARDNLAPEPRE